MVLARLPSHLEEMFVVQHGVSLCDGPPFVLQHLLVDGVFVVRLEVLVVSLDRPGLGLTGLRVRAGLVNRAVATLLSQYFGCQLLGSQPANQLIKPTNH